MQRLVINNEIYTEVNLKETCSVYHDYARIDISKKIGAWELIFNDCKYDEERTVKEFENYLIDLENK